MIDRISILILLFSIVMGCARSPESEHLEQQTDPIRLWTESERQTLVTELERTMTELVNEVEPMNEKQWSFKPAADKWSVSNIVEHLELQDEMYYREIYLISKIPIMPKYAEIVRGNDEEFLKYASDPTLGKTSWNLEPIGRFCDQVSTITAFKRVRGEIIKFVTESEEDFRQHFTFRNYKPDGGLSQPGLWDVRDLHQLLLTTIAHTDRHIDQVRAIKTNENFPGD